MGVSNHEMTVEALKSSPPVTVSIMALGGITLQDWVLIATLFWIMLQAGWFIYSKFFRKSPPAGEE